MVSIRRNTATALPYIANYARKLTSRSKSSRLNRSNSASTQTASSSSTSSSMQGLSRSISSGTTSSSQRSSKSNRNKKSSLCQKANKFFRKIMCFKSKKKTSEKKPRDQQKLKKSNSYFKNSKYDRYEELKQLIQTAGEGAYIEANMDYNSNGVALHTASVIPRSGTPTKTKAITQVVTKAVTENSIVFIPSVATTTESNQPAATATTDDIVLRPETATTTSQIAEATINQPETTAIAPPETATTTSQITEAAINQPETTAIAPPETTAIAQQETSITTSQIAEATSNQPETTTITQSTANAITHPTSTPITQSKTTNITQPTRAVINQSETSTAILPTAMVSIQPSTSVSPQPVTYITTRRVANETTWKLAKNKRYRSGHPYHLPTENANKRNSSPLINNTAAATPFVDTAADTSFLDNALSSSSRLSIPPRDLNTFPGPHLTTSNNDVDSSEINTNNINTAGLANLYFGRKDNLEEIIDKLGRSLDELKAEINDGENQAGIITRELNELFENETEPYYPPSQIRLQQHFVKRNTTDANTLASLEDYLLNLLGCRKFRYYNYRTDWNRVGNGIVGSGANGKIYKVALKESGYSPSLCAVKSLVIEFDDKSSKRKIMNEVFLMAQNHRNLMSLRFVYSYNDHVDVLMDILPCCLYDVIKSRTKIIPPRTILYIFREILEGLNFLHYDLQFLHGDIKPENILISLLGRIKITDFGQSRRITNRLHTGLIGTDIYMAPEVLFYQRYNEKVDIWSLALTTMELFSFRAEENKEITDDIANDTQYDIPSAFRHILVKMFRRYFKDRASTGEIILDFDRELLYQKLDMGSRGDLIRVLKS